MIKDYFIDLKREFSGYNAPRLIKDILAGLTVGAVALPLALAFGTSAGATASAGLVTGVLAGVIIAIFSGGSFQISGPTGAMAAILMGLAAKYGIEGIFIGALISGVILIISGALKLGRLVTFIPAAVITGFTSGIAIVIAMGQIDNFFGVSSSGEGIIAKFGSYFSNGFHPETVTMIIGLATVMFLAFYPKKINNLLPGSLVVIIISMILNIIFKFDIATVGAIPKSLLLQSHLSFSDLSPDIIGELMIPGISIAILNMTESLLCGATASKMKNEGFNGSRELIAQGIGNIIIPFFGGIPATAAIARTSVAIKSGGITRLTSVFHSLLLLMSMLVLGQFIAQIPLASLAGVLIVTSWRMNEWDAIKEMFDKKIKTPIIQFAVTMISTVVFDLTVAIFAGVMISIIMFAFNNTKLHIDVRDVDVNRIDGLNHHHEKTKVMYLSGTIFFGNQSQITKAIESIDDHTDALILSMRGVASIDDNGVKELEEIFTNLTAKNINVYFSGMSQKVLIELERHSFLGKISEERICWDAADAIIRYDRMVGASL